MPFGKWESFEDCVRDFVSQGKTEDSARRICGALKAKLEKEGKNQVFSWEGEIALQKENLISGKAIHPIKTLHPEEWLGFRVYLEEELMKAAGSLVGAPLLLDHIYPLDGKVLDAKYVDGAVEYVAELNDERVLGWIKDETIKHCSVEYEWDNLERVNGVAPRGIAFTGLALLKNYEPGDPETTVKVWESIIKRLRESSETSSKEPTNKPSDVEAALDAVNSAIVELAEKMEKNYEGLRSRLDAFEKLLDARNSLGEAVVDPTANHDGDRIDRSEVLTALRQACYERVPRHWSYGAYLQNRRLKELIRRLESLGRQGVGEDD